MNTNNNINTGLAPKADMFRWSGNLDNKPKILGIVTSAPDFNIPPTPASSYQNLHVVLNPFDGSSNIINRTETLQEPTQFYGASREVPATTFEPQGTASASFSSLPSTFTSNKLDDVPRFSKRLVPERVDPDQPLARSDAALTSLKSEIAPIAVPFVGLDEYPEMGLVDETESLASRSSRRKEWALLEEEERSWRMSREVDSNWTSNWQLVGRELLGSSYYAGLEEEERLWRMARPIDQTWASKWSLVSQELLSTQNTLDDIAEWTQQLTASLERDINNMVQKLETFKPNFAQFEQQLRLQQYSRLSELEETERTWRMSQKIDPTFYRRWYSVGEQVKTTYKQSWSEWLLSLKDKALVKAELAVEKLEDKLESIELPNLKLGVIESEATTPLYSDYAPIDFTFKKNRVPYQIIELEEAERTFRISRGRDAFISGLWFRLGQELQYKNSLKPTLSGIATSIAEGASALADKAVDTMGSLVESAQEAILTVEESLLPAKPSDFAARKHLNLFAFTAENIDFSFKSGRTPAYILALEEEERAYRIKNYSSTLHKRWYKFLSANLPKSNVEKVEGAFISAVHKAEDKISGFFGSVANALHLSNGAREDKVDPMTAARVGRVNDELLNLTVKSV